MTLYLIHFDPPYKHARHYLGYTDNLPRRLAQHLAGNGSRLMEVITAAGVSWQLVRVWPGTRADEKRLKKQHNSPRLCPCCNPAVSATRFHCPDWADLEAIPFPNWGKGAKANELSTV